MTQSSLREGISNILAKIFLKKGKAFAEIMLNWGKIIGDEFASQISPIDIKYYTSNAEKVAVLILECSHKANILKMQFSELIILERINNYFGYKAITKIKLM